MRNTLKSLTKGLTTIALATAALTGGFGPQAASGQNGGQGPARVATAGPARGAVLFADDFSAPSSLWDVGPRSGGRAQYGDGQMLVRAETRASNSVFVSYDRDFTDQSIEVEMKHVGGTLDNWQSVACRMGEGGNYYDLGISADGYYMLDVWVDGRRLSKSIRPTRSRHIRQGRGAVNQVRADCIGETLRLTVNGQVLAELTDDHHETGEIGLSVDSMAGSYSEVAFDNLVVTVR